MRLHPEEPAAESWAASTSAAVLAALLDGLPDRTTVVIAVDGRSGAGKTTVAAALAAAGGGTVVHTDDVAWNHSFFGWHDRLVEHVLRPVRDGRAVGWRPGEWPDDKPGAIVVPAGAPLLVLEGVSAGAARLAAWFDRLVWVQSDRVEAEERGIARDVAEGRDPAEARRFWDQWQAQEVPLLALERPWERADAVLASTSTPGVLLRAHA